MRPFTSTVTLYPLFRLKKTSHIFSVSLLSAVALLFSGCMVGPDYQPPAENTTTTVQAQQYPELRYEQTDLSRWWSVFNDPELTSLISRAKKNNLDIMIALARVKEARAALGVTSSDLYPSVDANGSIDWSKQSENVNPMATGEQTQYTLAADAGWEVDLFGRIRRSIEAATADYQATWEDHNDIMITVLAETATTYLLARSLQAQLATALKNIESQQAMLKLTEVRYKYGIATYLDVAQATQVLANTEAELPVIRTKLSQAVTSLSVLVGESSTTLQQELQPFSPIPMPPEQVAVGIPAERLRQRPDIRYAERLLAAQTARVGIATADLYPTFSLIGTLGFSSLEFIVHGYPLGRGVRQKTGFGVEDWVPIKTANFIKSSGLKGRMYNDMGFGGYLIWDLYPERKVFIDGRNLVYGEDLYRDYWRILRRSGDYELLLDKYDIDYFVLRTLSQNAKKATFIHSYLSDSKNWIPVYWDDISIVYAKTGEQNSKITQKIGFRFIDPIAKNNLQNQVDVTSSADDIVAEIKRMLENAEDSVFANIIAAKVYSEIGYFEEALERYRLLSKLDPKNVLIFRNLGILYQHYRYYTEAEDAFAKALQLDSKNGELYFLLAEVCAEQQKFGDAIKNYQKAIKNGEDTGEVLLNLAMAYEGKGDKENAKKYLQEVISNYPKSKAAQAAKEYENLNVWKAHIARAEQFKEQGKIYDAIDEYQIALAAKPDDAMTLTILSALYMRTQNPTKALEVCLQATKADSTFAGAYNNLGVIYSAMKDMQSAKEAWQKAVELDPQSPAKQNLEKSLISNKQN